MIRIYWQLHCTPRSPLRPSWSLFFLGGVCLCRWAGPGLMLNHLEQSGHLTRALDLPDCTGTSRVDPLPPFTPIRGVPSHGIGVTVASVEGLIRQRWVRSGMVRGGEWGTGSVDLRGGVSRGGGIRGCHRRASTLRVWKGAAEWEGAGAGVDPEGRGGTQTRPRDIKHG